MLYVSRSCCLLATIRSGSCKLPYEVFIAFQSKLYDFDRSQTATLKSWIRPPPARDFANTYVYVDILAMCNEGDNFLLLCMAQFVIELIFF